MRRAERCHKARADGRAQVAQQIVSSVHNNGLFRTVIGGELAKIDQRCSLDCWRATSIESAHALCRLDLCERIEKPRVARFVQLAGSDEAAVSLHAHLDQVARHRNCLANATRSHACGHFCKKRSLVLGLIAAEEATNPM